MDIRHLEYFIEVVRQGSFSKAANTLNITQPSISKMIKCLEEDLGVILLYRQTKRLELTDAGHAVLERAQQIVSLFQNLSGDLDGVFNLEKGKINIGLPPIASSTIFPQIFGEFNKAYPGINIQLFEFGSKRVEIGVHEGSLDVGLICSNTSKPDAYDLLPMVKDPLRIIIPPSHPLAQYSTVDFSMLSAEPFILYNEDFSLHDRIIEACAATGFEPQIICKTSQREFMIRMVEANVGIALLPGHICDELNKTSIISLPLINPEIFLQLSVIWKKDRYLPFAVRKWLTFIAKYTQLDTIKLP